MAVFRSWVRADWMAAHPDDADMLIAARAVECGVPTGVEPRRSYSPWRKAYLCVWEWPEDKKEMIHNG